MSHFIGLLVLPAPAHLALWTNLVHNFLMEVAIAIAKGKLTQLVAAAERGERVIITRHGKPVAQLLAAEPLPQNRFSLDPNDPWRKKFGFDGHELPVPDDFDDPDFILDLFGLK
jgi:prevent-host-death family protein